MNKDELVQCLHDEMLTDLLILVDSIDLSYLQCDLVKQGDYYGIVVWNDFSVFEIFYMVQWINMVGFRYMDHIGVYHKSTISINTLSDWIDLMRKEIGIIVLREIVG
jgi:hypothetical protein